MRKRYLNLTRLFIIAFIFYHAENDILAEKCKIEVVVNKEAESINKDRTISMALLMSHRVETGITKIANPLKERNSRANKQT